MELIVGGKSQGKLDYALNLFNLSKENVSDGQLKNVSVILNLQDIIRNFMTDGIDPENEINNFIAENPSCIIICDEIGCGLVPVEQFERDYRDTVGKICCNLAKKATRVHRVICGIGTVIKNA